jgi:lipopolysaccharide export system protein LptA
MVREAFAERLEGFGQDKLVLSGAPRVVQDKDTVKGYRITMREKMEYIEVEDALSDVQVKQDAGTEKKKRAKER